MKPFCGGASQGGGGGEAGAPQGPNATPSSWQLQDAHQAEEGFLCLRQNKFNLCWYCGIYRSFHFQKPDWIFECYSMSSLYFCLLSNIESSLDTLLTTEHYQCTTILNLSL